MIKMTILLRRRQDMSFEEFVAYHKTNHAPLFSALPEVQQYIRRYVQTHIVPVDLPGLPAPAFDGTTELWFDDVEAIGKVFGSEPYLQTIRPDEEKFLDLIGCSILIGQENPVFSTEPA